MKKTRMFFLILTLSSVVLIAQKIDVASYEGCSVVTELSSTVKVNKESTLMRSWVVFNDSGCPIQLGRTGVMTTYRGGEYSFRPEGSVSVKETVTAFDIRFLLFDVFGDHMENLTGKEVKDTPITSVIELKNIGSSRASENEVSDLLTVVSFVAKVRTSTGKIWKYNTKLITEELIKIKLTGSDGMLESSKKNKFNSAASCL